MAYLKCPFCDLAPRSRDFQAHINTCRRKEQMNLVQQLETQLAANETRVRQLSDPNRTGLAASLDLDFWRGHTAAIRDLLKQLKTEGF